MISKSSSLNYSSTQLSHNLGIQGKYFSSQANIFHRRQIFFIAGKYFSLQAGQIGRDETSSRLGDALRHGLRIHRVPLRCLCSPSIATSLLSSILLSACSFWIGLNHLIVADRFCSVDLSAPHGETSSTWRF